jgi:ABC-type sugar transport system permease subunit
MWLFMLPSLVVMTVVLAYPLASAIYYSFLRYYLGGGAPQFIGLANYLELLADARFWGDLLNTVIIVGASVVLQLVVGLALALALYAATRGVRLISLLNFLPNVGPLRPLGRDADLVRRISAELAGRPGVGED